MQEKLNVSYEEREDIINIQYVYETEDGTYSAAYTADPSMFSDKVNDASVKSLVLSLFK